MDSVRCSEFRCNCGRTMLLPIDTLWQLMPNRDLRPTKPLLIALACPACHRLATYRWGSEGTNPRPDNALQCVKPPVEEWHYEKWLRCNEATCESRLPLL